MRTRGKGQRTKSHAPVVSRHPGALGKSSPDKNLKEFVENLSDAERVQLVQQVTQSVEIKETFIGPLPPPADFAKYEQTVPGAANRILSMAEREQQIRADGQNKILTNDSRRINTATCLGIGLLVIAGIATWKGYIGIAVPLGLAGVISSLLRLLMDWSKSRK